jgi:hypothetical protein
MHVLIIEQNEYAHLTENSKFTMIGTTNLQSCIGIAVYSKRTKEMMLMHLDVGGNIKQVINLIKAFPETAKLMLIFNLNYYNDDFHVLVKDKLNHKNLGFDELFTTTGSVVLKNNGDIRTDYTLHTDEASDKPILGVVNADGWHSESFQIYRAPHFRWQGKITNLNNFNFKKRGLKMLRTPITENEQFKRDPEILDITIINFFKKMRLAINLGSTDLFINDFLATSAWKEFGEPELIDIYGSTKDIPQETEEEYTKELGRFFNKNNFCYFLPKLEELEARHQSLDKIPNFTSNALVLYNQLNNQPLRLLSEEYSCKRKYK